jgi:hypothetical protein
MIFEHGFFHFFPGFYSGKTKKIVNWTANGHHFGAMVSRNYIKNQNTTVFSFSLKQRMWWWFNYKHEKKNRDLFHVYIYMCIYVYECR